MKPFNKEQFLSAVESWSAKKVMHPSPIDPALGLIDIDFSHMPHFDFLVPEPVEPVCDMNTSQSDVLQLCCIDCFLLMSKSRNPITPQKTARALIVEDCRLTQHVMLTLLKQLTPHVYQVALCHSLFSAHANASRHMTATKPLQCAARRSSTSSSWIFTCPTSTDSRQPTTSGIYTWIHI